MRDDAAWYACNVAARIVAGQIQPFMQELPMTRPTDVERIRRRIGSSSRVELEFYCRRCKGHFARTFPVASLDRATCRCGGSDILVYAMSGESSAPLRYA
jgi:hypothetical protein